MWELPFRWNGKTVTSSPEPDSYGGQQVLVSTGIEIDSTSPSAVINSTTCPVLATDCPYHPRALRQRKKTRRSRRSVMPYPSPRGQVGRRRTALTRLGGGQ